MSERKYYILDKDDKDSIFSMIAKSRNSAIRSFFKAKHNIQRETLRDKRQLSFDNLDNNLHIKNR